MGKTIKQIADEIGVSKQAVQKRLSREPLYTSTQPYIHTVGGTKYIEVVGENLIKSAFSEADRQPVADNVSIDTSIDKNGLSIPLSIDSNALSATNEAVIDVLKQQLDTFQEQLTVKDQLIEQLQSELAAERQHSREEVEQLTAALTAAQALHAADKQQQLILMEKNRSGFLQRFIEFFKRGNGQN